jgi:UPF0316 protein cthe_2213
MEQLLENAYFTYLILPILIILARVTDVTFGTIRIVFVARGNKIIAPLLGFFEVFIWIVAISQIMQHANNIVCYLAYALGFAIGNYVGLSIEHKLAVGMQVVRIITAKHGIELSEALRTAGFGTTLVDARGASGPVHLLYCVALRKDIQRVEAIIHEIHPQIFYSVEDVKSASSGIFAPKPRSINAWRFWRKGK